MTGTDPAHSVRGALARARALAGRVRRSLASAVDRLLQPPRRVEALTRLRSVSGSHPVLFLCLGNVCRSPYAAARFRAQTGETWTAESAGFIGPGRAPPQEAVEAARRRGLDTSRHVSRLLTPDMLEDAGLVVVMDASNARRLGEVAGRPAVPVVLLGDLDPDPVVRRGIRDPWGGEPEAFQAVFSRIDRCVEELVAHLAPEALPAEEGANTLEGALDAGEDG